MLPSFDMLGAFALLALALTITPGVDTAITLRAAMTGDQARTASVIAGICSGLLAWGALAAVGVSALLAASEVAYTVLRLAGAAYLVWIGVRLVIGAIRGGRDERAERAAAPSTGERTGDASAGSPDSPAASDSVLAHTAGAGAGTAGAGAVGVGAAAGRRFAVGLRHGALTNLLNPKVGAFYAALLPQFIPAGAPQLAWGLELAAVHVLLTGLWLGLLAVVARLAKRWLARPAVLRSIDGVSGVVIAGFGVRLALTP